MFVYISAEKSPPRTGFLHTPGQEWKPIASGDLGLKKVRSFFPLTRPTDSRRMGTNFGIGRKRRRWKKVGKVELPRFPTITQSICLHCWTFVVCCNFLTSFPVVLAYLWISSLFHYVTVEKILKKLVRLCSILFHCFLFTHLYYDNDNLLPLLAPLVESRVRLTFTCQITRSKGLCYTQGI